MWSCLTVLVLLSAFGAMTFQGSGCDCCLVLGSAVPQLLHHIMVIPSNKLPSHIYIPPILYIKQGQFGELS